MSAAQADTVLSWQTVKTHITGVTADSRRVRDGFLFAALPSETEGHRDGTAYLHDAKTRGGAYVLGGRDCPDDILPKILSDNPKRDYAIMAAEFYAPQPEHIVAVTGTNAKSSIVWFLRHIWQHSRVPCASVGTHGFYRNDTYLGKSETTSPDAGVLVEFLAAQKQHAVDHIALEASSHGLQQSRLAGLTVRTAIISNLSRDHLDYHRDMDSYRAAKHILFADNVPSGGAFLVSEDYDDAQSLQAIAAEKQIRFYRYGFGAHHDFALEDCRWRDRAMHGRLRLCDESIKVTLPLCGRFQWQNALAAAAAAYLSGVAAQQIQAALAWMPSVWGRLQSAGRLKNTAEVFVDYAHTPDALSHALKALREHLPDHAELYCVFGCGGSRDQGKRVSMGRAVEDEADVAIVTDDNPRDEDPAKIRLQVLQSVRGFNIGSRRQAIHAAVRMLRSGDILLIAGKGHEDTQIRGKEILPFDDIAQARAAIDDAERNLPLWRTQEIAAATSGEMRDSADAEIFGLSIDSRRTRVGDLFIALKGTRDGSEFISAARQAGAAAVTAHNPDADIIVADSQAALENLAQTRRESSDAIHIGVTGSLGKTTMRFGLQCALAGRRIHGSTGSFNNHIGLPLSLALMPRDTQIGIFEMGMNHPGEIKALTEILRPEIALITNIAPAHIANFDSFDALTDAKAEIFHSMRPGTIAVLPHDSAHYQRLVKAACARDLRIVSFGTSPDADCFASAADAEDDYQQPAQKFTVYCQGAEYVITAFVSAEPWAALFAGMMAAVDAAGASLQEAADALCGMQPFAGRGNRVLGICDAGAITVIDDSYNASPEAVKASLRRLGWDAARFAPRPRKIAVLGDMLELGDAAPDYHRDLLESCLAADVVHLVGEAMRHLYDVLPEDKRGILMPDAQSLADALPAVLNKGDIVLVKGSAGMRMGMIVDRLTKQR